MPPREIEWRSSRPGTKAAAQDTNRMQILNALAVGYVGLPPRADRDADPVRSFATFTQDLNALADWLQCCRVRSVAMESTSVYWIPVYQILESRGFEVYLVNAHHLKNVPGPTLFGRARRASTNVPAGCSCHPASVIHHLSVRSLSSCLA
jgi:Transposase